VLSCVGRSLCDGLITRPEDVCLYMCDQETPKMEAKGPSWTIIAGEWMNEWMIKGSKLWNFVIVYLKLGAEFKKTAIFKIDLFLSNFRYVTRTYMLMVSYPCVCVSQLTDLHAFRWQHTATIAAFTLCKLDRASQVPGIRTQTFHSNYGKFDRLNFESSCDFRYVTCMTQLRPSPGRDSRETTYIV
jgi:hypothetical protein